jgi:AraC-like DNA-binding protein
MLLNFQLINEYCSYIKYESTSTNIIWYFIEELVPKLGLEDLIIYRLCTKNNKLVQFAASGPKACNNRKVLNPQAFNLNEGIVGSTALQKKTQIIEDTDCDERYIVDDQKRGSEIAIPILNKNKVVGVIDSENIERDFYSYDHKRFFEIIATLIAPYLKAVKLPNPGNSYLIKLNQLLEKEEIFLDEHLSLNQVAKQLRISPQHLSKLIHCHTKTSFSDIINRHRVCYFLELIHQKAYLNNSLLVLAYQSGFSSKSSFNRIFKQYKGVSPSYYIKQEQSPNF